MNNIRENTSFKLSAPEIDPITGASTSRVTYNHIDTFVKDLDNIVNSFPLVVKQFPEDSKLIEYGKVLMRFKKQVKRHLTLQLKKGK
jgi:hypothetical protein